MDTDPTPVPNPDHHPDYLNKKFVRYRFSIKMSEETLTPMEQMIVCLKLLFKRLKKVTKTLEIAPWDDHLQQKKFLKKEADIPNATDYRAIWHLADYFKGFRSNPKFLDKIIMTVRLAWNPTTTTTAVNPSEIGMMMEQAFPETTQTIGIWKHPLVVDAPSDVCLGWFLYSTRKMHSEDYKRALIETLRQQKIVIDPSLLGLKWQAIAHTNGQRPQWNKEDPNPSALHLYVAKDYDYLVRKQVGLIYATPKSNGANKLYPNKVMLRLIPCYQNKQTQILEPSLRTEIVRATDFQLYFNQTHIRTIEFSGVLSLDSALSDANPITLREIVMGLAPQTKPTKRLFQSVDTDWKSHFKCHFTTVEKMHDQALDMVSMLLPFLRSTYGKEVDRWFSTTARTRADSTAYDPTSKTVTSTEAASLKATLEEDVWEMSDAFRAHQTSSSAERPMEFS